MFEDLDLNAIQEENARELIKRLLNLIEQLSADLRDARAEIQRLRDEVNRLKGEQGKPKIKENKPAVPAGNYSSEKERHKSKRHGKRSKKAEIHIDREEVVKLDRSKLPADAEFKEYVDVVVQDIRLETDNVRYWVEKRYSASANKTYQAELPRGYAGQFGPGIKAFIPALYFGMGASEPKIQELLRYVGIRISEGEISNLLIKGKEDLHAEADAVYEAGLRSSFWQHTDDTATRVNGVNQHCHVMCNPVYTSYHTLPNKDRLSVLDVLRNGRPRRFLLNQEALDLLESVPLSQAVRQTLQTCRNEIEMDEQTFQQSSESLVAQLGRTTIQNHQRCRSHRFLPYGNRLACHPDIGL